MNEARKELDSISIELSQHAISLVREGDGKFWMGQMGNDLIDLAVRIRKVADGLNAD